MPKNWKTAAVLAFMVLTLALTFRSPLEKFLFAVPDKARSVKIGKFQIEFRDEALGRLPVPPEVVLAILPKLSTVEREALISVGNRTPADGLCTLSGLEEAFSNPSPEHAEIVARNRRHRPEFEEYVKSYISLEDKGLVQIQPHRELDPEFCPAGEGRKANITTLGSRVREYYLSVLSASIQFRRTPNGVN